MRQRIDYIKTFYRRHDAETDEMCSRERVYLTEAEMDGFVEEATGLLDRGIRLLRAGDIRTEGRRSMLEVLT